MPASQPQPITEVAKPVMVTAAWRAQRMLWAVMTTPRRLHAEGLGEGVVDRNAACLHDVALAFVGCTMISPRPPSMSSSSLETEVLHAHRMVAVEVFFQRLLDRPVVLGAGEVRAADDLDHPPSRTTSSPSLKTYSGVVNIVSRLLSSR